MSNQTTIDLQPFVAKETTRYCLNHPFVFNGFRFATDGKILIRIPAPGEADTVREDGEKLPPVETLTLDAEGNYAPWPNSDPICEDAECPDCDGTGKTGVKSCAECDGTGYTECSECGQDTDCDACDGEGEIGEGPECEKCNGDGRRTMPVYQAIGTGFISYEIDQKVRQLCAVEFLERKVDNHSQFNFRFDGGVGLIAGHRGPGKR